MKFNLSKQAKITLLTVTVAFLVGGCITFYVGYRLRQSGQSISEAQEPAKEKKAETVENPDGSKTYFSYIYDYKIDYPGNWELNRPTAENVYREINLRKRGVENTRLETIVVLSGDAVEGVTFEEYLAEQRQHNLETYQEDLISRDPNFEFAGTPTYKYEIPFPWESLVLSFERNAIWYEIWVHQSHQEDPEYWSILNTFEFLDK